MIPHSNNSGVMGPAQSPTTVSRRTLAKGAAWAVPVIAAGITVPALAASGPINNFSVNGTCGSFGLGILNAGFRLVVGGERLPAGTVIDIVSDGVNINSLTLTGLIADVQVLGERHRRLTFNQGVDPGAYNLTTVLSVAVVATTTATLSLPSGFTAGPDTKSSGSITATLVLCTPD